MWDDDVFFYNCKKTQTYICCILLATLCAAFAGYIVIDWFEVVDFLLWCNQVLPCLLISSKILGFVCENTEYDMIT